MVAILLSQTDPQDRPDGPGCGPSSGRPARRRMAAKRGYRGADGSARRRHLRRRCMAFSICGVAAMVSTASSSNSHVPVGDEAVIAVFGEEGQLGQPGDSRFTRRTDEFVHSWRGVRLGLEGGCQVVSATSAASVHHSKPAQSASRRYFEVSPRCRLCRLTVLDGCRRCE